MAQAASRRRQRRRALVAPIEADPFRLAFEHAPVGIAIHDAAGEIVAVNLAMRKLLGRHDVDLAVIVEAVHPDERIALHRRFRSVITGETFSIVAEHRFVQPDVTNRRVRLHVSATRNPSGRIISLVTHAVDVTEQREQAQELLHQTLHDPLTGLPNRTLLRDRLGHALSRSARTDDSRVALLFLDLDYFKLVNDSLGHATGDAILIEAATRLRATVRPSDTVARFGGDEFVVCCEDVRSGTETIAMAERILATMRDPFLAAGQELRLTTSIGIALATRPDESPEALLRDADTALYVAKGEGRDRFEIYDDGIRSQLLARVETAAELRRAVDAGELRLHYQPTFALGDHAIVAVEALLRWEHPERGLLEPDAFLSIAGQVNLDVRIGDWVLRDAAAQARAWRDTHAHQAPPIWINLSARQLTQSGLPDRVAEVLAEHGLPSSALGFEVRESVLTDVEQTHGAGGVLGGLAALGCRIAIDDFGTAYSSLRALGRYHVDTIKIDQALVGGLPQSRTDAALVEHVISLGRLLDLVVCAEGVETEAQLRALREAGCSAAAGYLLAAPSPAAGITDLLKSALSRP
ncbi:MAG: putative bifunctional diguanylate cyclase/phosphodiesterase [Acidimicrobiia bacterium]